MAQTTINELVSTTNPGMPGQLADMAMDDAVSRLLEGSDDVAFGIALAQGTADNGVVAPGSGGEVVGVLLHSHAYAKDPGGDLSLTDPALLHPKSVVSALRKGRVWVKVGENVAAGDRAWVRTDTGHKGEWAKSSIAANAIDCSKQARYMTTATSGNMAVLEVDFTNKA